DLGRQRAIENTAGNSGRPAISFARTRVARRLRQPRRSLCRRANRDSEKVKRTRTRDLGATSAIAWSGKFGLNSSMKISLGTDHAGFNLKEKVKALLGERVIPEDTALAVVRVWLTTDFEGGRHIRRIAEIESGS